jgi:pimeloyl-ACP methyl ester carboxylesterase
MVTLTARLDVEALSWVGTSLGGLAGMALAAQTGTPVARLVLNDAGPVVAHAALERIGTYVGRTPVFRDLAEAEAYIRAVSAPFGPHSDEQWRFLTETWVRKNEDGSYRAHYDPRIGDAFRAAMPEKDLELWALYDAVRCPTLVLRGERSDLLAPDTCLEMARRGPKARIVEIAGVGHAPTLLDPQQISIVKDFLLQGGT